MQLAKHSLITRGKRDDLVVEGGVGVKRVLGESKGGNDGQHNQLEKSSHGEV